MPSPPETGIEGGDKVGHFLAYASLMAWFCFLYGGLPARVSYAVGFAGLGVALEFAQGAFGYRLYDTADMAANALGVLLGWAIAAAAPTILRR